MISPTHGSLSFDEMMERILCFLKEQPDKTHIVTIGCDSHNYDHTQMALVVAVQRVGNGGIYFFDLFHRKRITSLQEKIYEETNISLEMAQKVSVELAGKVEDVGLQIHVDIGEKGPTSRMIKEIVGWVTAMGYDCQIKPYAWTASGVADKISKYKEEDYGKAGYRYAQ